MAASRPTGTDAQQLEDGIKQLNLEDWMPCQECREDGKFEWWDNEIGAWCEDPCWMCDGKRRVPKDREDCPICYGETEEAKKTWPFGIYKCRYHGQIPTMHEDPRVVNK